MNKCIDQNDFPQPLKHAKIIAKLKKANIDTGLLKN